jgi:hypothetical protein
MKQFFAILAAVCLLSVSNVFANGTITGGNQWDSPTETGYFELGVFCVPTIQGNTTSANLGSWFSNTTVTNFSASSAFTGKTLSWYLTGPKISDGASYKVSGSGYSGYLPSGATTATTSVITATGGSGGNSTLSGNWILPDLSSNDSPVKCTANNTDTEIQFVATSITTSGTGSQSFAITLTVNVSI